MPKEASVDFCDKHYFDSNQMEIVVMHQLPVYSQPIYKQFIAMNRNILKFFLFSSFSI